MYALVRNGTVVRTFDDIPEAFEDVSGFHLMSVLERRNLGFLPVTDARPPLTNERQSYIDETYTPGPTAVTRTATVFERPKTTDEIDREAVAAYPKLTALKTSTPAQVQAWVDANVTDLASAKDADQDARSRCGIPGEAAVKYIPPSDLSLVWSDVRKHLKTSG